MACCLTAPSHYLNQCWLIISKHIWHPPGAIWQGIHQPSITKISYLKFCPNLTGVKNLISMCITDGYMSCLCKPINNYEKKTLIIQRAYISCPTCSIWEQHMTVLHNKNISGWHQATWYSITRYWSGMLDSEENSIKKNIYIKRIHIIDFDELRHVILAVVLNYIQLIQHSLFITLQNIISDISEVQLPL